MDNHQVPLTIVGQIRHYRIPLKPFKLMPYKFFPDLIPFAIKLHLVLLRLLVKSIAFFGRLLAAIFLFSNSSLISIKPDCLEIS